MSRQGHRQDWMSFYFQNLPPPLFSSEVRAQMYERESIIVYSPFSIFDSLSFPHMQPGSCTKSIGHLALPESSHRGLHVPGESATHRGKVLGGGKGRLETSSATEEWRSGTQAWCGVACQLLSLWYPLPSAYHFLFLSVAPLFWRHYSCDLQL